MMYQIEGLNSIIECRRTVVSTTGGVSEGMKVNGWLRSIIVDIGGKGCIVGRLTMSVSLLVTMMVAVALSMGRSVTAHTAIGPILLLLLRLGSLLLLSELGVCRLALNSTQIISLGIVTPSAMQGHTFLLVEECSRLDDII